MLLLLAMMRRKNNDVDKIALHLIVMMKYQNSEELSVLEEEMSVKGAKRQR